MKTMFKVGESYKTQLNSQMNFLQTICKVVARTKDTISVVEEFEDGMQPVVVPIRQMSDRYGRQFEMAYFSREWLCSDNIVK